MPKIITKGKPAPKPAPAPPKPPPAKAAPPPVKTPPPAPVPPPKAEPPKPKAPVQKDPSAADAILKWVESVQRDLIKPLPPKGKDVSDLVAIACRMSLSDRNQLLDLLVRHRR